MKEKKEKIQEWAEKGAEWCATKLYEAREIAKNETEKKEMYKTDIYRLEREMDEIKLLKKINNRMAQILESNGVRPVRLRITYKDKDCQHCKNNGYIYGEDAWNCQGCGWMGDDGEVFRKKETVVTETEPFYCYQITGNEFGGINGFFESIDHDEVLKIVDLNTNEVLYPVNDEQ